MTEYSDVPVVVVDRLRACCTALPVEGPVGPSTILGFRAAGEEPGVLSHAGHPFFSPGWGADTVGMVLDDSSDWDEVDELVTESCCVQAPKRLAALVERPPER